MSDQVGLRPWKYGKPPHLVPVEVEIDGKIIIATAVWGGDGYKPHWRTQDGAVCAPSTFRRWRLQIHAID